MKKNRSDRGFTVLELLVVVAIIGVLSAVLLVGLQASRGRARYASISSGLDAVTKALALFQTNNRGQYPCEEGLGIPSWTDDYLTGWPAHPFTDDEPDRYFYWNYNDNIRFWDPFTWEIRLVNLDGWADEIDEALDDGNLSTGMMRGPTTGSDAFNILVSARNIEQNLSPANCI